MRTRVRIPRISVNLDTVEHICNLSGSYYKKWAQGNPQELTGYEVWHREQLVRNPIPNNGEGKDGNSVLSSDLHMNATARPFHKHREAWVYSLERASAHTHIYITIAYTHIYTTIAHTICKSYSHNQCTRYFQHHLVLGGSGVKHLSLFRMLLCLTGSDVSGVFRQRSSIVLLH